MLRTISALETRRENLACTPTCRSTLHNEVTEPHMSHALATRIQAHVHAWHYMHVACAGAIYSAVES